MKKPKSREWKIIRVVEELFYVQDAENREDAIASIDSSQGPHSVSIVQERAIRIESKKKGKS